MWFPCLANACKVLLKKDVPSSKKTFVAYLIPPVKPGKDASGYKRMYLPEILFR